MTKEEFDSKYVGNTKVVNCKTKEDAMEFLTLANSFGYRWHTGVKYSKLNVYPIFKNNETDMCFRLAKGEYSHRGFYQDRSYTIINYIPKHKNKNKAIPTALEQFIENVLMLPSVFLYTDVDKNDILINDRTGTAVAIIDNSKQCSFEIFFEASPYNEKRIVDSGLLELIVNFVKIPLEERQSKKDSKIKLQEAIEHIDEIIEKTDCEDCKNEHLQLKEWLVELAERREKDDCIGIAVE